MRRILGIGAVTLVVTWAMGCGGTVNYNPATTVDATPPAVNLLVMRPGQADLEVQGQVGPSAKKSTDYGKPVPPIKSDFSILATATDAESGIRNVKLHVTRTVCYVNSNGTVSPAYFGTKLRKEATYTDQQNAPTQPSLGETGIIDNSPFGTYPANLTATNLLVWENSNGNLNVGVGVSTKWTMEATNFAGQVTNSDVIFVLAGETSCVINP